MPLSPREEALYLLRRIFGVDNVHILDESGSYQIEMQLKDCDESQPYSMALRAFADHLDLSHGEAWLNKTEDMIELGMKCTAVESPEMLMRLRNFSLPDLPSQEMDDLQSLIMHQKTSELNRPRTLNEMRLLLDRLHLKTSWRYDDDSHEFVTLEPVTNARNFRLALSSVLDLSEADLPTQPFDTEGRASLPVAFVALHYEYLNQLPGNRRLMPSISSQLEPCHKEIST